jgi:hypothetical protein
MGTVKLPVPVWRSGEKVSPMPCKAPPPCGSAIAWLAVLDLFIATHRGDAVSRCRPQQRVGGWIARAPRRCPMHWPPSARAAQACRCRCGSSQTNESRNWARRSVAHAKSSTSDLGAGREDTLPRLYIEMIRGAADGRRAYGWAAIEESAATTGSAFSATVRSTTQSIIVRSVAIALVFIVYPPERARCERRRVHDACQTTPYAHPEILRF